MFAELINRALYLRGASFFVLLAMVTGCSKSFVATGEVPQPLIERIPVTAKLEYSEEFKDFSYIEVGKKRALEKVEFGQAQITLFDQIFGNMFTLVPTSASEYDLKIEPSVIEFQYSAPSETSLKIYEIWLKYRLRITDSNDTEIADWVVKGYGKSPTSTLVSQLVAFNAASNVALRDIGAQLALGFSTQPSIERFLRAVGQLTENRAVAPPASQVLEQQAVQKQAVPKEDYVDENL